MNNRIVLSPEKRINPELHILCKKEQEVQRFFHWDMIEGAEIVGPHHHPKLEPVFEIPNIKRLVTLNNAPYEKHPEECGLCFYTKDSVIERIWKPHKEVSVGDWFRLQYSLQYVLSATSL